MSNSAAYLANNLKVSLAWADTLLKGVDQSNAFKQPHPTMNHAGWVLGHLALSPDHTLAMLGRTRVHQPQERFEKLFASGTQCQADASLYPSFEEIVSVFRKRHEVILSVIPELTDIDLEKATPNKRFAERFPKIGHGVHFLFGNHIMFHLGQMSAWRRTIGLPSAM